MAMALSILKPRVQELMYYRHFCLTFW